MTGEANTPPLKFEVRGDAVSEAICEPIPWLNEGAVRESVDPYDAWSPTGRADTLAQMMYRHMEQSGTSQALTDFLREAEDFIDTNSDPYFTEEENTLRATRIIAIVADMPVTIPAELRLEVWRALFSYDPIVGRSGFNTLEKAMFDVTRADPDFGALVLEAAEAAALNKITEINRVLSEAGQDLIDPATYGDIESLELFIQARISGVDISTIDSAAVTLATAARAVRQYA